jgi:hypothetical protein
MLVQYLRVTKEPILEEYLTVPLSFHRVLGLLERLDKPVNDVKYKNSLAYFGIISDEEKRVCGVAIWRV